MVLVYFDRLHRRLLSEKGMKNIKVQEMKPYTELTSEELAMEKLFVKWIQSPDDHSISVFWEGWIEKNPEMKEKVFNAKMLVKQASDFRADNLSNGEVNSLWGRIRNSLDSISERDQSNYNERFLKSGFQWKIILVGLFIMVIFLILGNLLINIFK